jgi:hypothetical protein
MRTATERSAALVAWTGSASWVGVGSKPGAGRHLPGGRPPVQRLAHGGRGGDDHGLELVDRRRAGLDRTSPCTAQHADRLHDPVAPFGQRGRGAGQHRSGGGLGVDRVALAALAAGGAVGAVGLQHLHAVVEQEPGQPGAVGAGAFHPDRAEPPVATQPPQQLAVAVGVGAELGVGQQPAVLVDDGGVVGAAVGVDPADDNPRAFRHAGPAFLLPERGTRRPGGRTGQ